jgi:hypothetical protein
MYGPGRGAVAALLVLPSVRGEQRNSRQPFDCQFLMDDDDDATPCGIDGHRFLLVGAGHARFQF